MYRTCQPRFPLFSITSRSERPKLPGCRAIPECRSGLMHHPPARSAAPPPAGTLNEGSGWPLRVDRWGGPPGPLVPSGDDAFVRLLAGRPGGRPWARAPAPHRSTERGYRAPSLRTPCGTIVRVPDGLGVGRRSIYTAASGRIYPGKCQQRALPNQVARQFERIGSGARMNSASIFDLSPSEKLQLVEDMWDDLAAAPEAVPVHDWQKQELVRRKANLQKTPASGLSWEDVKRNVRARYAR